MLKFTMIPVQYLCILMLYLVIQCKGDCTFPSAWSGKWFQAGIESYLEFNSTYMESKGSCRGSCYIQEGDKFILLDRTEDESDPTYKCFAMFMKHTNVIQYKEVGKCERNRNNIDECCTADSKSIAYSDNALNTLIRVDKTTRPIPCPFSSAPYSFSYSHGGDDVCSTPMSRVDACTDPTKLLFRFSACADIKSSQSSDEEMTCLATWHESSSQMYLIARLTDWRDPSSPPYTYVPPSDENSYRCFVYSNTKGVIKMAQSGAASCDAIPNPDEGSKLFELVKDEGAKSKCQFSVSVIEDRDWRSLDGSKSISYNRSNGTLRIISLGLSPAVETTIYCLSIEPTNEHKHQKFKAFALSGCNSGYMCLSIYHRDSQIIQVQYSDRLTSNLEDACSSPNFDSSLPLLTMIPTSMDGPRERPCPQLGRWVVNGSNNPSGEQYAVVGCEGEPSRLLLGDSGVVDTAAGYHCLGAWGSVNDTGFILASLPNTSDTFCFIYHGNSSSLSLKQVTNSCDPTSQQPTSDNVNHRLSYLGKCGAENALSVNSGASTLHATLVFLLVVLVSSLTSQSCLIT
uniref:Uncharacterized protein n=1 Tax=Cacopsylla melanoneura TaxID=428564 RepID=A0A8D8RWC2_9HEMI